MAAKERSEVHKLSISVNEHVMRIIEYAESDLWPELENRSAIISRIIADFANKRQNGGTRTAHEERIAELERDNKMQWDVIRSIDHRLAVEESKNAESIQDDDR